MLFNSDKFDYIDQTNNEIYNILKIQLNNDNSKPYLITLPGFSEKSFNTTSHIIINNSGNISDIFNYTDSYVYWKFYYSILLDATYYGK